MMTLARSSAVESHPRDQAPEAASELLVAELALNDIATVQATRKGKARENAPRSDQDIAFDLQATSLSALIGVLRDRQFASSVDHAIESDARQLRRLQLVEQAERDDRQAALALGNGHDLPRQTLSQRMLEWSMAHFARESSSGNRGRAHDPAENITGAINVDMEKLRISTPIAPEPIPRRSSKDIDKGLECIICGDDVVASRSFKAPICGHYYCRGCIVNLVETSLRDESLHPLRCCRQPLPLASGVFRFISTSLRLRFLTKSNEYSTPPGSRVYCSNPRCSEFLNASGIIRRDLTCDECYTVTCSQCKNNSHPGEGCSEHQSMLKLRETAATNKWQTCPECQAIVELSQGCYHITCRCSTQFCYLCSARWKTCDCRQWDEELLLNDAERRVRNEFGDRGAVVEPAVHAERVYQRMEALREDHECHAHLWRYRHGCGQCEECGDFLPVFLMRCVNCQNLVCRRCSVNRL